MTRVPGLYAHKWLLGDISYWHWRYTEWMRVDLKCLKPFTQDFPTTTWLYFSRTGVPNVNTTGWHYVFHQLLWLKSSQKFSPKYHHFDVSLILGSLTQLDTSFLNDWYEFRSWALSQKLSQWLTSGSEFGFSLNVNCVFICQIMPQYRKTSYISHTLVCNKIVDNSDVVGASPVSAAPTTSSFST